jgi:hypothetical protein
MWKSCFSQLLDVNNISDDVKQIKIHTTEPLIPCISYLDFDIAITKMNKYKSPGNDQISEELNQAGGETLVSLIHKLVNSI